MSLFRTIRRNPLILPFYLPSIILSISMGLLVPVMPLYAKELSSSYAMIGVLLSGLAIGMLIGDVPSGLIMRRMGQKTTMLVGAGVAALATAALFWAPTIGVAIGLRIVTGFAQALYTVARHSYIAGAVSRHVRGRAIALFGGLGRIGRFLGPLIGGLIGAQTGLRTTFLWYGAINLLAFATMAAFVENGAAEQAANQSGQESVSLWQMLKARGRVLASAGLGQTLAQTIRAGRMAIIPLYAADVVGLDVQQIGLVVSLASAIDMSLFYPAGWIMDHWGRKCAIVPSFVIQAIGMALVPLTHSFGTLLAASGLMAFGNGLGSGSMMTLGADLSPQEGRGEFLGVWRLIGDVGSTSGPVIVGQVAEALTLPMAALAIAVTGLGAGLVFGLLVPEPLKWRKAQEAEATGG